MDDEEPKLEPFTIPVPPPGFPPGGPFPHFPPHPGPHDVVFIRSREDGEAPPGKDHEDIMLRRVPRDVAMRYRAAAGGRGMTHAQYLTALVELHAKVREAADQGDERARTTLDELGLQTVSI